MAVPPSSAGGDRSAIHPMRCGGAKSFVDDLVLGRGVVLSRAATSLRSIETQPLTRRFVRFETDASPVKVGAEPSPVGWLAGLSAAAASQPNGPFFFLTGRFRFRVRIFNKFSSNSFFRTIRKKNGLHFVFESRKYLGRGYASCVFAAHNMEIF